jgi:hypothetical protein
VKLGYDAAVAGGLKAQAATEFAAVSFSSPAVRLEENFTAP